jgi:hypothetical protein
MICHRVLVSDSLRIPNACNGLDTCARIMMDFLPGVRLNVVNTRCRAIVDVTSRARFLTRRRSAYPGDPFGYKFFTAVLRQKYLI